MIEIGKVIKTHGLDGAIYIQSDFEYPELVFQKDKKISINDILYTIEKCSYNNKYYLIKFKELKNIDEAKSIINSILYIQREEIDTNEILKEELIGLPVYTDKLIGHVKEILTGKKYDILKLDSGILIPNISQFVISITKEKILIDGEWFTNEN